jgi:hypothetical protein
MTEEYVRQLVSPINDSGAIPPLSSARYRHVRECSTMTALTVNTC